MSGREGCADTAMNTSTSGYIQRRIVKLTEDIKVNYDQTCRDTINSVYQTVYGETGINPTTTVKVGKDQEICDVDNIIRKLNIKYEDLLVNKQKKIKNKK
jgi:DNA-directed RNA polymerase beta' subunit